MPFLFGMLLLTETLSGSVQSSRRQQRPQGQSLLNARSSTIRFNISYTLTVPSSVNRMQFLVLLPHTLPDRQKIISIDYTPEPQRIFQKNGNTYAEYVFNSPAKQTYIDIFIKTRLYRYDLSTAMSNTQLLGDALRHTANIEDANLAEFLKQEKYIEKDSSAIKKVAQDITGQTEVDIVQKIYNYVLDNMEYVKITGKDYGAATALRYRRGDCTEYSDLFVAICRAKGIPARVVSGYTMGITSTPTKHNWAEVYFKDYGWVPFELSGADSPLIAVRNIIFSRQLPEYLYLSYVRSDKVLNNFSTCWLRCWGGPAKLTDSVRCRWLAFDESK